MDKPAGQMVIPADKPQPNDEVTMKILRDQIGRQVHPIHRLDRPTSGVLLFATDRDVARELHFAFERHEVHKTYLAVIDGSPDQDQWNCREALAKNDTSEAKPAETHFRILQEIPPELTLIEASPKSGRFHQIRRHLALDKLPIVGDYRYAEIERCDQLGAKYGIGTRMLLQAKSLKFQHPVTKKDLTIEAPLDPLIQKLTPS
ncbi:MAG: pseudouridine synthase [Akkermansiaceae bacterium]|nr:pseudouridine synthase [Akkermansiaceae bacterium]